MGKAAFSLDYMLHESGCGIVIQIYEDTGKGFSEENSYRITDVKQLGKEITFRTEVSKNVQRLRIDPGNEPTFVVIKKATLGSLDVLPAVMKKERFGQHDTNGKRIGEDGYMFIGADPHFAFKVPAFEGEKEVLTVTMLISEIPGEIASRI